MKLTLNQSKILLYPIKIIPEKSHTSFSIQIFMV